ncbi:MAG TPA: arginine--tRNA ligase [Alphaproteobacteria bacterium]|nr:arginine--tRNA ligase [Alphaproteobacteria bacterium]HNS44171.1 arginine--tRNA ligase [Alphaproteobacteria bacterium]
MYDKTKTLLSEKIAVTLANAGIEAAVTDIYESIEACPQPHLGQYAFKTFAVAKQAKMNPKDLGTTLADKLSADKEITAAEQSGPYLNITLSASVIGNILEQGITSTDVMPIATREPHRYLIEHSQPNTHKEMHIGHTRNSVLGDTLCRLLKQAGHHVYAENYHGDEGAHVAKCLWYIGKYNLAPAKGENPGTWLGRMYVASTTEQEEAQGDDAERIKGEISDVLKQIEERHGHYYDMWKETRKWSLDMFHEVYGWLDIKFDGDTCESDVSEASSQVVEDYLAKGVFIKDQGAIGADLSDKNLGFCMLRKSDGRGLYATKDLALALRRFEKEKPDTCVYVVDNRQSHHFKQVFATLDLMGFKEAERCYHLAYEMVETKNGAMSSRKGNIVPILQLIDELESHAKNIIKERYGTEWDEAKIDDVAKKISCSAVRYGMIKVDPESKIVFDMDSWLTMEGHTGPYLQYVYARISSLQRKSEDNTQDGTVNWAKLDKTSELQLLAHLSALNESVDHSCKKLKPNIFASYTYELARKFNAFYAECPINSEPDSETRHARAALVQLSKIYLGTAMDLLGIPRIEQM